ncbi:MAG: thioredoxin family protein [Rhodospirillales bacterium]|nr:thioredoxin family protein [Rhodospirillales bacterium]
MLSRVSRRMLCLASIATALLLAAPSFAGEMRAFDQAAFAKAQADGKPILVAVHADWCPVCQRMKPVEAALLKDPANKDVVAFVVDFDRQADALKKLNVTKQATQVFFKGATEVGRHSFVTDKQAMQKLIDKAKS